MARYSELPPRVGRGVYFLPFDAWSEDGERGLVVAVDSQFRRVFEKHFNAHSELEAQQAHQEAEAVLDECDPLWKVNPAA